MHGLAMQIYFGIKRNEVCLFAGISSGRVLKDASYNLKGYCIANMTSVTSFVKMKRTGSLLQPGELEVKNWNSYNLWPLQHYLKTQMLLLLVF